MKLKLFRDSIVCILVYIVYNPLLRRELHSAISNVLKPAGHASNAPINAPLPALPFFPIITTTTTSRPLRAPPRISLSTMDASTDSSIDDLAARTTVKDYGNIRYVMACQP